DFFPNDGLTVPPDPARGERWRGRDGGEAARHDRGGVAAAGCRRRSRSSVHARLVGRSVPPQAAGARGTCGGRAGGTPPPLRQPRRLPAVVPCRFWRGRDECDPRPCLGSGTDGKSARRWTVRTACRGRRSRRGRLSGTRAQALGEVCLAMVPGFLLTFAAPAFAGRGTTIARPS